MVLCKDIIRVSLSCIVEAQIDKHTFYDNWENIIREMYLIYVQ